MVGEGQLRIDWGASMRNSIIGANRWDNLELSIQVTLLALVPANSLRIKLLLVSAVFLWISFRFPRIQVEEGFIVIMTACFLRCLISKFY